MARLRSLNIGSNDDVGSGIDNLGLSNLMLDVRGDTLIRGVLRAQNIQIVGNDNILNEDDSGTLLNIDGAVVAQGLTVKGTAKIHSLEITGGGENPNALDYPANTTDTALLKIDGGINATNITARNDLVVSGTATINSAFTANNTATFNSATTFTSSVYFNNGRYNYIVVDKNGFNVKYSSLPNDPNLINATQNLVTVANLAVTSKITLPNTAIDISEVNISNINASTITIINTNSERPEAVFSVDNSGAIRTSSTVTATNYILDSSEVSSSDVLLAGGGTNSGFWAGAASGESRGGAAKCVKEYIKVGSKQYNGSSEVTITREDLSAASEGHTHSGLTFFDKSTIEDDGVSSVTYNGAESVAINYTTVGAASEMHNHDSRYIKSADYNAHISAYNSFYNDYSSFKSSLVSNILVSGMPNYVQAAQYADLAYTASYTAAPLYYGSDEYFANLGDSSPDSGHLFNGNNKAYITPKYIGALSASYESYFAVAYSGSSNYVENAISASYVKNPITFINRLISTDPSVTKVSYCGSTTPYINYNTVGAASSGHNHKNLIFKGYNSTTSAPATRYYTGSSEITINYWDVGAASSHYRPTSISDTTYIGSTSYRKVLGYATGTSGSNEAGTIYFNSTTGVLYIRLF